MTNLKTQIKFKSQIQNFKCFGFALLNIGIYLGFVFCNLEFIK